MTSIHPSISLVPFVGIIDGFQHSTFSFAFKVKLLLRNLLGNLVLLLPLGVFLPMLWSKFRYFKKTVLVGVTVSLSIELVQLALSFLGLSGRIADIDDLILNSIGVLIGYFIYSKIMTRFNVFSKLEQ
jgi:glycopeptide antibiotics resistance protein